MAKRREKRFASDGYAWICELLPGGNGTVLVKNSLQLIRDVGGVTMLDVTALHHVDQLPISEQRQRRRGRRISGKVRARAFCRLQILAGKNAERAIGTRRVLQSRPYRRTQPPSSATADRIYDYQSSPLWRLQFAVYLARRPQLLNPQASKLFAHGNNHNFRIHFSPRARIGFYRFYNFLSPISRLMRLVSFGVTTNRPPYWAELN